MLLSIVALVIIFLLWPLPETSYSYSTVLNDRMGNLLGASIAGDGQWRFPEPDSVPAKVATCIQHFEDRNFYRHPGINPLSIARAMKQNMTAGKVVSGASTLTMQIARMLRGRERTLWQKLIEMFMALKLELRYSKSELMVKYASMAPFGGNVVGIDAASWRYFNRPAHLLSWGEAASLAVLPNNPGAIFPGRSDQQFKTKRDQLLSKLLHHAIIDSTTYDLSLLEELPGRPYPIPQQAPHLLKTLERSQLGTTISSTLDPFWQSQTTQIAERHHTQQLANGVENLCALVVDLQSSEVLAYIGNTNDRKADGYQVDIIQKPRSPGSSLKPLLYANALHRGELLPKTLLPDVPSFFGGYSPKNFSEGFEGAVPADEALARSLNIPFVYLLKDYSYEQFHSDLKSFSFSTLNQPPGHYGLSLILGGGEVTLWNLVNSYSRMYAAIAKDAGGAIHYNQGFTEEDALPVDPGAVWHTFQAMTELSRPDTDNNWRSFSSSQLISWKTGTSFGFRDAWAVGLNGKILVGVWVGNADGEGRAGLTGIRAAAPLLLEILRLSDHDRNWLEELKPTMPTKDVCSISGMLANPYCPSEKQEVPKAAENSGLCRYHQSFYLDETGLYRVNSSCYPLAKATQQSFFILPPSMGAYFKRAHPSYKGLPPLYPQCSSADLPLEITYPTAGSKVYVPITLQGESSKLILEASHQDEQATIFWSIGAAFHGSTRDNHKLEVVLPKGVHTLTITDQNGNTASRTFEVISDPQ